MVIKNHNKSIMNGKPPAPAKTCNCRNNCPLSGNCQVKCVIYQATVTSEQNSKNYIGLCATPFKTRWANHKSSFNLEHKRKETELSKHIWNLKDKNVDYNITWKILKQTNPYSNTTKRCQLCLWEKYFIIMSDKSVTLNKRSELISKCRHSNKFLLKNFTT